jgi:hypothetical protein
MTAYNHYGIVTGVAIDYNDGEKQFRFSFPINLTDNDLSTDINFFVKKSVKDFFKDEEISIIEL